MKYCLTCKLEKEKSEFHKDKYNKDGLCSQCKSCRRKYRLNHPEYDKKYDLSHKPEKSEYNHQHYLNHRNEKLKKQKRYQNSPKGKEVQKKAQKQYYLKNKIKLNNQKVKYTNTKRNIDPIFKLLDNIRRRLNKAIERNSKSARTIELLGCTIKQLKDHLEFQFVDGMNWENQGKWHIDHKIPCSSFDLNNPEEQRKCFHYSNLQPLWAIDNLKKSNKTMQIDLVSYNL